MHLLFGWQFISNSLVYFTFFSLMKHERLRRYVLISQFSTNIYAVDFMLYIFLKITTSYFWVTFSKTHLVAGIFLGGCWGWQFWMYIDVLGRSEIIPMAADETAIGHIYRLLVVWIHVQWLSTRYSEDVYICPWHTKGWWIISRWIEYQPKSNKKYMLFLLCISSFEGTSYKYWKMLSPDLLFVVVFISFYISWFHFLKNFLELYSILSEKDFCQVKFNRFTQTPTLSTTKIC